jgi:hypothetical protein
MAINVFDAVGLNKTDAPPTNFPGHTHLSLSLFCCKRILNHPTCYSSSCLFISNFCTTGRAKNDRMGIVNITFTSTTQFLAQPNKIHLRNSVVSLFCRAHSLDFHALLIDPALATNLIKTSSVCSTQMDSPKKDVRHPARHHLVWIGECCGQQCGSCPRTCRHGTGA